MPAATQQESIPSAPVVKFIIAGTRPCDCSAKNVATVPDRIRQHHTDMLAGASERRQFPAQNHAGQDQPAVRRVRSTSCHRFRSEQYRRPPASLGRNSCLACSSAANRLCRRRSGRNAALVMMSCMMRPSAARRARPISAAGTCKPYRRQHRQAHAAETSAASACPASGTTLWNCKPSIRTGTIAASALSAIMPGPS